MSVTFESVFVPLFQHHIQIYFQMESVYVQLQYECAKPIWEDRVYIFIDFC